MSAEEIKLLGPEELKTIAREWHAYVMDKTRWTDEAWQAAQTKSLAVKRTFEHKDWNGKQGKNIVTETQRWTLTDAGLDLFLEGCESEASLTG